MAKNTVTHATSDFKRRCETVRRVQKAFKKFVDPLDIMQDLPKKYDNVSYMQRKTSV
jgi:hypothetical protein